MFRGHFLLPQMPCLVKCQSCCGHRARSKANLSNYLHRTLPDNKDDGFAHSLKLHPQIMQNVIRDALAFAQQAQQQVFGTHIIMAQCSRFFPGQVQHNARLFGELLGGNGQGY